MNLTVEKVISVLKEQIASSKQAQAGVVYNDASVRARIVRIAERYGDPVLDVGTGACACMAVALARQGLRVTAIDHASGAVRIAEERTAGNLSGTLEIQHVDASQLPFPDGSYRVVVAFDMLCHTSDPAAVIGEIFRVSSGVVVVSELNRAGRQLTRHLDEGFDLRLPSLLGEHCQNCQRFDDAHHVTYVCERI